MKVHCRQVFGYVVESAIPLVGLSSDGKEGAADLVVKPFDGTDGSQRREWPAAPFRPVVAVREAGRDSADFWFRSGSGRSHRLRPATGVLEVDPEEADGLSLTHLVVDAVMPGALSRGNCVVLHGAVLETGGGCVAALGDSGVGKSTLAALWVSGGRRFLSDDWFVIRPDGELLWAYPSHPSIRLREPDDRLLQTPGAESRGPEPGFDKHWYSFGPDSGAFCQKPRELRRIFFLSRTGSASGRTAAAPIGSRETMARLMSSLILLEIDSHERWEFLLPLLSRVEAEVPREELRIPEGKEHVAEVVAMLEGVPALGR